MPHQAGSTQEEWVNAGWYELFLAPPSKPAHDTIRPTGWMGHPFRHLASRMRVFPMLAERRIGFHPLIRRQSAIQR